MNKMLSDESQCSQLSVLRKLDMMPGLLLQPCPLCTPMGIIVQQYIPAESNLARIAGILAYWHLSC